MDVVDRLVACGRLSQASRRNLSSGASGRSAPSPVRRAHRRHRDAAERHRGAGDLAGRVLCQQRRRRDDGEIAVPARELDEAVAMAVAASAGSGPR